VYFLWEPVSTKQYENERRDNINAAIDALLSMTLEVMQLSALAILSHDNNQMVWNETTGSWFKVGRKPLNSKKHINFYVSM